MAGHVACMPDHKTMLSGWLQQPVPKSPKEKMVICALLYIRIDYLTLLTVVTVLVTMVHWSTMTTAWNQLTLIDVIHACQLVCPHVYM